MKKLKRGDNTSYVLEVGDINKVLKLDKRFIQISDNRVKIICEKNEITSIVKKVLNVTDLFELRPFELSLEEAFFEKAGGNIID
jgi:hypothetical protein